MPSPEIMAQRLEDILPQTQCRQCGFDGCAQYALAMAAGKAAVNRCAPGGAKGIARLAKALGTDPLPLDPEYGRELPFSTARINALSCIGCALCAAACPVEVISGTPKHLFAVIDTACTGCGLCVCACPVNAVDMIEAGREWTPEDARAAKKRYEAARLRRLRIKEEKARELNHDAATRAGILAAVMKKARQGAS